MIIQNDRLMTIDEAAYYLNVYPRTIYRKIYEGVLLAYKVGGVWRMEPQEVLKYVRQPRRI
ncbi:helix-turn-helix domain-containing protein [Paenibacillus sp. FJAT-26967]|uniref:helix-turn-helix domain-containing protein n=1 Tax=Paenibacillus sp. FJAT-26967 TaxID=1729690 RepID=UPI0008396F6C